MPKQAIYPGTFDPITLGHLDIIRRASKLFDQVTVAIYDNPIKVTLFTPVERAAHIVAATSDLPNVSVDTFSSELLVSYAARINIWTIIRGLRAITDFDYELSYAQVNRNLDTRLETVFLMTSIDFSFLSSTMVKEVASLGGDVSHLVPVAVARAFASLYQGTSHAGT